MHSTAFKCELINLIIYWEISLNVTADRMSRISSIDMLHIRQHHQFADPSLNFFSRIQFETEIKGSNEQKILEIREENDEEGKKRK